MKKLIYVLVMILILSSFMVGCAKKPPSTTGPVEEVIYKFAVFAPITGNYAEYGKGFEVATQMAVDEINGSGGINGAKIELQVFDTKGDPRESADIARRVAEDKSVLAVIGDFTSSNCMANAPILGEAGIVQLSPTASHTDYAGMNEYMFSIMGRQDGEAPFFSSYLLQKYKGAKDVAVIHINNDWGKSAFDNFSRQAKIDGLNVVAAENFVEGERDFNSLLTKVRAQNPDTVALIMHANDVALVANQIAQMGWDVDITALGPGTSMQIIELAGKNVEGLLLSTPFFITEENEQAWATEFKKRANFQPTVHPACAYDTVYLLKAAIENISGEVTRDGIRENLQNLKGFVGLTGPIEFNPAGDITRSYLVMEIVDGAFVQRTDFDYAKK
ncbi:ABC transporter substrate-binding protein [Serpentinicella alkaliphila]|uniref:Amino acid/amide ABC transporter substrate-binding protein (HAAT family) n=1 Tax=Serpentinicella alkaliphila TaxID=1734049 RepID=A0A4R2U6C7_9FIRM|nr:ABC transporter substrate-binding protein [Serpentinicella alkaliphila]QUH26445.1 ABC transporter substrate-binding protein [Serpentinicella alkaliphila]TCQ03283.1 amino acid/amide ABC transporter substrate-binding protein (HAAT family) [Serpentinicella alkaliphila]